jgi:hypothetical protein
MTRRKDPGAELKEASIQDAIEKIKCLHLHAANETGIPRSVLPNRLNGIQPRNKSHEKQQLLIHREEQ